jgi:hypothetical protein
MLQFANHIDVEPTAFEDPQVVAKVGAVALPCHRVRRRFINPSFQI